MFYLHEPLNRLRREILALDALGIGLFASTGAVIALDNNASSLAATLIGATAAIGVVMVILLLALSWGYVRTTLKEEEL